MTVSLGNGVDIGNIVTADVNPLTGGVGISAGDIDLATAVGSDAAANAAAMQRAANSGHLTILSGAAQISDTVLIGSNTRIEMRPGVVLTNAGAVRHTMFRTGNAEFVACANINNVWILCADEGAYSKGNVGTLEFVTGPARLRWKAPGDTGFGAYVDVSGASLTNGWFSIPSASANKAVHVLIGGGSFAGAAVTKDVRVEPVTGAKPIAWTRSSNVVTVGEVAHGRRIGDIAMVFFGASCWHGYVTSATDDTWTFAQTGTDASGSASAYGVKDVEFLANGAQLDYNGTGLPNAVDGHQHMVTMWVGVSGLKLEPPNIINNTKYGTYVAGCVNASVHGAKVLSGTNDCVHLCGPAKNVQISNVTAEAGDNVVGIGCTDYVAYNVFFPTTGVVDIDNYAVENIEGRDTLYEIVRLYVANSGWLRNGVIRNIRGTVDPATSAAVGVITDNTTSTVDAGNTNIDGLEIDGVNVAKTNGGELRQVTFSGTGTRRNIRLRHIAWKNNGGSVLGSIYLSSILEDITIDEGEQGDFPACGAYIYVSGSGEIKNMLVRNGTFRRLSAAASGGNYTPVLLKLDALASKVNAAQICEIVFIDESASGNQARLIETSGKKTLLEMSNIIVTSTDPSTRRASRVVQFSSTAETGSSVYMSNVHADCDYGMVMDGGVPDSVTFAGYKQPAGSVLHGAAGAPGTVRVRGSGVLCSSLLSPTLTNITADVSDGLPCDVTRAARVNGNWVNNTNAGAGTLAQAGLVACEGTSAGSWKRLTNPALTY